MEGKRISFIKNIVLDKESLERLDRMLNSFFSDVQYDFERKNNSNASEKKCKDVLEEINGGANKITSLSIHCRNRGVNGTIASASIEFNSYVEIIEPSMKVKYAFDNAKMYLAFEQTLRREVDGFSRNTVLFWVEKGLYLFITYFWMCVLAFVSKEVFGWESTLDIAGAYIIGLFSALFLYKTFRPSVWFKWGKMSNAYKLLETIFWVVVVGMTVSIVAGLILKYIE